MKKTDSVTRKKPSRRARCIFLSLFLAVAACLFVANPSVGGLLEWLPKAQFLNGANGLSADNAHLLIPSASSKVEGKEIKAEKEQLQTNEEGSAKNKSSAGGSLGKEAKAESSQKASPAVITDKQAQDEHSSNSGSEEDENRQDKNKEKANVPVDSESAKQKPVNSSRSTLPEEKDFLDAEHVPPVEKNLFSQPLSCEGKYIFMYDMPKKYNQGFLDNCAKIHRTVDMCEAFSHGGAGWPANRTEYKLDNGTLVNITDDNSTVLPILPPNGAWYETDQFSLEIIFHARMKEYPCLTTNPYEATLFYIPFFPGLAIFRSLYEKNFTERDRSASEVVQYLQEFPWWGRHRGRDHLLVITRVLIDFTREIVRKDWGTTLMKQRHMKNCNVLGIESHPRWARLRNVHSIPYPTSFHPSSDEHVLQWQKFVREYHRKYLVAFMGRGHGFGANLRRLLASECHKYPGLCNPYDCKNRTCIMKPQNVIWFYLGSKFCMQPPGDTPTRKGLFDCMLAGGIPVVFHDETSMLYRWHLPADQDDVIIYIPKKARSKDASEVIPLLKSISNAQIQRMHERVVALIPHIAYAMPGNTITKFKDAFSIAIENALKKVSRLNLPFHPKLPEEYLT